ncbi:MAG TPA: amphi-Trp domain-containing protein [Pseudonocardiaceae bacterium]
MSDLEIERTESLTRQEAARYLSALATALADGGQVEVALGNSTLRLRVPEHVQCEIEVEVDGDEVELELELKWSTADQAASPTKPAAGHPKAAARAVKS